MEYLVLSLSLSLIFFEFISKFAVAVYYNWQLRNKEKSSGLNIHMQSRAGVHHALLIRRGADANIRPQFVEINFVDFTIFFKLLFKKSNESSRKKKRPTQPPPSEQMKNSDT